MILFDLLNKVTFNNAWRELKFHCDYDSRLAKDVENMYLSMLELTPFISNKKLILVEEFDQEVDDDVYYIMGGKLDKQEMEDTIFWSWEDWLGANVDDIIKTLSEEKVLAFAMHEMSIFGFDYLTSKMIRKNSQKSVKKYI
jgi:hypothetical protein